MNNLANLYSDVGNNAEAKQLFAQTLEGLRRVAGREHPATLTVMHNLAAMSLDEGDFAEAERLLVEVVASQRRVLGPEHPSTLNSIENLARALNNLEKSIPLYEEALHLHTKVLGKAHPETISLMGNLGASYKYAGRIDQALPLLESCYRVSKDLPSFSWVRAQLVDCYVRTGQTESAQTLAIESMIQAQSILPKDSTLRATCLANAAVGFLRLQAWSEAEPLLQECLMIRERQAPDSLYTCRTRFLLGVAQLGQQKYAESEPVLVQGYEGMKLHAAQWAHNLKSDSVAMLEQLVQLYEATEKPDEAAKWRGELEALKQRLATPQQ